jgi:5-(carboxyamino)imidazole ribonucleotide synthase
VKTPRGGYDGKGVRVVRTAAEVAEWFATVAEDGRGGALLVEELVDFRRELAQLVARPPVGRDRLVARRRDRAGRRRLQRGHRAGPHSAAGCDVAADVAISIAEGLGVTACIAVELFETTDDRILVNELAMRPHNSGHWSMDGSTTGQFEQHLRACSTCRSAAPAATRRGPSWSTCSAAPRRARLTDRYAEALAGHPTVKLHNYGKDAAPGRKVGHVTAIGSDLDDVVYEARAAAAVFQD